MSMVSKTTAMVVDPTQQMTDMLSRMVIMQGQAARTTLSAVDEAAQQEIEALTAQIAVMEKTVAASHKALAEARVRALDNPRVYAAKRLAEKAKIVALQNQIAENERLEKTLTALKDAKEDQLQPIQDAFWLFQAPNYWVENKFPAGSDFIKKYVGEAVYKRDINRRVTTYGSVPYFKDV